VVQPLLERAASLRLPNSKEIQAPSDLAIKAKQVRALKMIHKTVAPLSQILSQNLQQVPAKIARSMR
jgi:hypothetical protein